MSKYHDEFPQSQILDKLNFSSKNSPPAIPNLRIIFKFDQKLGRYDSKTYLEAQTKNLIPHKDIDQIFDHISSIEDCSEQQMDEWNLKRIVLFIIGIFTLLLCINCWLIIFWQRSKDEKQQKRMNRISEYLETVNKVRFAALGWSWKVGKWGGWLELSQDYKKFITGENVRLAVLNGPKNSGLQAVPMPIRKSSLSKKFLPEFNFRH
jgi:hypothetical protein